MSELQQPPEAGQPAPDFTARTAAGETISLADLRGKFVALFFYPKDNTPGCTIEACSFRDSFGELTRRGVVVLGVSADSAKSHQKFTDNFKLPFPLLLDEEKTIARAYGAWGEKSFLGKKYMGMRRMTFLIGPNGKLVKAWAKVKPLGHATEVLAAVEAASKGGTE